MNKVLVLPLCAAIAVGAAAAQTATQPLAPGQAHTGVGSTQQPANSTQPRTAPQVGAPQIDAPGSMRQNPSLTLPGGGLSLGPIAAASATPGQTITLDQALALAAANEPAFVASLAASRNSRLDKSIARSALLPSVIYHNQYLFTESNHVPSSVTAKTGTTSSQVFIANNGTHEYVSQGLVTETIGATQFNALARADAASAIANAELEISRRGLTSTVVGLFYNSVTAQAKVAIEERARTEAADFLQQTRNREAAREAAHADVVKAQLTLQQRQRDLADTTLAVERSHLDLGVLLFADPRSSYSVILPAIAPLPERATVDAAAAKANPELASAVASLRSATLGVSAAKAALLPDLVLNYAYGIDAAQFAVNAPDGSRNLGYAASATLDIPVWDWLATEHRIKQAQILRDAAKVSLSATQRRLIADLEEFYNELRVAHDQLGSLQLTTDTARESLRLSRLRYTSGEATVLEVVDAQTSLTAAELAQQDGTVRYQLALANLQTLTGTI